MTPPADYYISPSSSSSSSEDYSYDDSAADAGPQLHFLSNKILVFAIIAFFWFIVVLASLHVYGRWLRMSRNRNSNAIRSHNQDQAPSADGLSKAVIAQLPTFTYTAPAISDPGTGENAGLMLECAVCLSEFQENEKGRLLPSCKHSFHVECIDMWFYSHSTCPLCRAKVIMPTMITTSPLMPITVNTIEQQQELEGEEASQEAHIAIETTPYSHDNTASAIPDGSDLAHAVQIPNNFLSGGNSTQLLTSQLGSSQSSERPSPSSSAKTTRSIPHITIEIPTCQDINLPSPGCLSLTSRRSRCDDVGCSPRTPLKSPGLRESLKRMLNGQSSEGKRVFTSCNQEGSMDDGISKGDSKIAG